MNRCFDDKKTQNPLFEVEFISGSGLPSGYRVTWTGRDERKFAVLFPRAEGETDDCFAKERADDYVMYLEQKFEELEAE